MTLERKTSYHWIVGKQDDLYWIVGSSGVSLFLLASYFLLTRLLPEISSIEISSAVVIAIIFLIWTFFFDSTHFFATYSRTFLDSQYFQQNKLMLFSSLFIFLLGPFFLVTPLFLSASENQNSYSYAIFALIIFGSILWGYFHLIRQHWGFIALYQKKNNEKKLIQYNLDAFLLLIGSLWPFIFFLNKNLFTQPLMIELLTTLQDSNFIYFLFYQAGLSLVLWGFFRWVISSKALGDLFLLIGIILLVLSCWILLDTKFSMEMALNNLELAFRYLFITSLVVYSGYYFFVNHDWNIPKFLLIGSVLITHNLVLLSVSDFLLISACLTIYHNIQYHRIVRYFNVNHYLTTPNDKKDKHGLSVTLTTKLSHFIFFALLFSLLVLILRSSTTLVESGLVKMILITSLINGISLHHYFLDGLIWRTSKDKKLSASLKLST